jgi:TRAP-type C4-dicarboxylate transport system permease small subunit
MKLTAGTFAAYLGVLLFAGGTSLMSAAGQWHDGAYSEIEPFTTLGMGELFTGLAVLVGGLALVVLAVIDAVKPPFTVHVAEPAVAAAP